MDSLPRELLESILIFNVQMCRCNKNNIFPLRLVCKAFDAFLKPYIFKTIQLEFSKFTRHATSSDFKSLETVGKLCQAVYLDMMVVRDEDEITRLVDVFSGITVKVPELEPLLLSLRRYCMNDNTFDETDFRRVIDGVLLATPNMARLKLNLPFQVVGRASSTATLLLATTLASIASRPPEEYKPLETLVLDHVSDTTLISICNNPIDLLNALTAFGTLKNMVLSIKRQEARQATQTTFNTNLWFLIRKAKNLESLCLIGWNIKRDINVRLCRHFLSQSEWSMRSLPYHIAPNSQVPKLRYLELKRVDIEPRDLLSLIEDNSSSLKEVYLNEVYLKVIGSPGEEEDISLWIGFAGQSQPSQSVWIAQCLRNMATLHLDILRVTGLGYDIFEPDQDLAHPNYDLTDPSGLGKSFDQRFVEAVFANDDATIEDGNPPAAPLESDAQEPRVPQVAKSISIPPPQSRRTGDFDAEIYQRHHNTTSHFKRCIDGYFFNHNEQALQELQRIMFLADKGMNLISEEIARSRAARIDPATGTLDANPFL